MWKSTIPFLLFFLFVVIPAGPLQAQQQSAGDPWTERDVLHLNTIGVFSAASVIQSYGYIGFLADALSRKVYEPEMVSSMLIEATAYLRNVKTQLEKYPAISLKAGDQKFLASIAEIVNHLIKEAEALSSFAQTKSKEDLGKYEAARDAAAKSIEKTFKISLKK